MAHGWFFADSSFIQFWQFWQFRRFWQSLDALPRPIQWRMSCAGNTPLFQEAHFQSTRGRGSWDANGTPQSTELQAVLGFPPDSQTLTLAAVPPAPLPSEHSVEYTKGAFRVKQNLR